MVEPDHPQLSIRQQCKLLSIARSSFYYTSKGETEQNLGLMRLIDEQFLETPFLRLLHNSGFTSLWRFGNLSPERQGQIYGPVFS